MKKQPSARMAFIVGGLREPLKGHVEDNHGQTCTRVIGQPGRNWWEARLEQEARRRLRIKSHTEQS